MSPTTEQTRRGIEENLSRFRIRVIIFGSMIRLAWVLTCHLTTAERTDSR